MSASLLTQAPSWQTIAQLPGVFDFWDAQVAISIISTTSFPNPAPVNDPISIMGSLTGSGAAGQFEQGTSGARPILRETNGVRYLEFSGSQFMTVPSSTARYNFMHNGSECTLITAFFVASGSGTGVRVIHDNGGVSQDTRGFALFYRGNGNNLEHRMTRNSPPYFVDHVISGVAPEIDLVIAQVIFDGSDSDALVLSDDEYTSKDASSSSPSSGNASFNLHLGRRAETSTLFFNGGYFGSILIDGKPDDKTLALIRQYFAAKIAKVLP